MHLLIIIHGVNQNNVDKVALHAALEGSGSGILKEVALRKIVL